MVELRTLAGPRVRGKRTALVEALEVALDRGSVNAESAGGLALGDAPPDGLHYLFAQVYRIGAHLHMMPGGATSPRGAVLRGGCARLSPAARLLGPALS